MTMRAKHADGNCLRRGNRCGEMNYRPDWLKPDPEVLEIADLAREIGAVRALDIGCGAGRHSLMLAAMGFEVFALGESNAEIALARALAWRVGNPIRFVRRPGAQFPGADESFDYVLAWEAACHVTREVAEKLLSEISRVLRSGGIFQGTMLTRRYMPSSDGPERGRNETAFEAEMDKNHLHFCRSQSELKEFLWPMDLLRVTERQHGQLGQSRFHFVARKNDYEF